MAASRVLEATAKDATGAIRVAAWWAFRIGNIKAIDNKAMDSALRLLRRSYAPSDIIATIDCYYAYDTDRARYPFKPLSRWARYEFEKWYLQAVNAAEELRLRSDARAEQVALQTIDRSEHEPTASSIPSSKVRARESRDSLVRRSLQTLDDARGVTPPAELTDKPATIAEAIATWPGNERSLILAAGLGDRSAKTTLAATLPMFMQVGLLPDSLLSRLVAMADDPAYATGPHRETRLAVDRVEVLLSQFREDEAGVAALGVVNRWPAYQKANEAN